MPLTHTGKQVKRHHLRLHTFTATPRLTLTVVKRGVVVKNLFSKKAVLRVLIHPRLIVFVTISAQHFQFARSANNSQRGV